MSGGLDQTTGVEILEAAKLLVPRFDAGDHLREFRGQLLQLRNDGLHGLAVFGGGVALDLLHEGAFGHGVDSRDDLQLRSAFIDIHDARVAVETLAGVILHEARTAVDLDSVVGLLIGVLRREELDKRREAVGKAVVELHLLTLLAFERTFVRDMAVLLVNLDEARGFVQQRADALQFGFHVGEHLRNGGEADDRLAELLALVGVFEGFAVGGLAETHRLGADAQTGGVHQRHHVFDKAHLAVADQLRRSIGEDQLARRRSLDTHLVFDTAHLDAAVALVVDQHRQTAGVGRALFGAGQHQRNVAVAVGDETLHAVEQPRLLLLGPRGLEHHSAQIRSGVRLGEVHGAGSARGNPRQEFGLDLLRSELVERLGAVLKAPDVLEAGVGARHHFVGHHEADQREVKTVVLARKRHAAQARIDDRLHVPDRTRSVLHMVVHHAGAFVVHALGIRSNDLAADLARDLQHAAVGVHSVFEILRREIVEVLFGETALFQLHDLAHHRMPKVELQIFVI